MKIGSDIDFRERIHREVRNSEETATLASQFADWLEPGDLVAFYGGLGSGKTFFIKSVCKKLGAIQEATSPTFTIMHQYQTLDQNFIYHFDFYRVEKSNELIQLGLDEFFFSSSICLVEWADRVESLLPDRYWKVSIDFISENPEGRLIEIKKQ